MVWFKHYTNASKGTALQTLEGAYGRALAYGYYFLIVEYFTDKWDGIGETTFRVNAQSLANHLQVKQKSLLRLLRVLQDSCALDFYEHDNLIELNFPKLLEIRHRDALSSTNRPASGRPVAGKRRKEKKRREYGDAHADFRVTSFDALVKKYCEVFPGTEKGPNAFKRFCEQVKIESDAELILNSVTHYKNFLDSLSWKREPRTSVATYLGTIKSGHPWEEYKEPKLAPPENKKGTGEFTGGFNV